MFDPVLFAALMGSTALFSPSSLFSAGEQGAWYDPSDFSTMFQSTTTGTVPVTAVEQPVGLILDKSKGLALGSAATLDAWIASNTGTGTATITGESVAIVGTDASNRGRAYRTFPVTAGKWYRVDYTTTINSGGIALQADSAPFAGTWAQFNPTSGTSFFLFNAAITTICHLSTFTNAGGGNAVVTFTAAREVLGNHASQSTSASRPVLSARVNLLTYSEQFDNAAWSTRNMVLTSWTNAAVAPDGTTTAERIQETTTASVLHGVNTSNALSASASTAYTWSIFAKANGRDYVSLQLNAASGGGTTDAVAVEFYLAGAGSYGSIERVVGSTVSNMSAAVSSVGNGWYKCSFTITTASNTIAMTPYVWSATGLTIASATYTGDGTSGIYIWGADLRVTNDGVGIPAYQRVAAATDYDTTGYPFFLRFDGTDDSLATASVDFSATDKISAFTGVRKLITTVGCLFESSVDSGANNGAFSMFAPSGFVNDYYIVSRGTSSAAPTTGANTFNAPITNVVTGLYEISTDVAIIRVNGTQAISSATDQGTGNFGNYPLYIGRRGGSSLPYNGRLYSLIVRGAQSTTAQIASTEAWVDGKTGAY